MDRLEHFSVGVVRGEIREPGTNLFPAGEPRYEPSALELLATTPKLRPFRLTRALGERLAAAAEGGVHAEFVRGLALHLAAQRLSSPFETRAQQIELDEEGLRALLAAVPEEGELDPLARDVWESLAWLFTEKRMPDLALTYLEPVAERSKIWPELDRAVGHAYREHLEPAMALRSFERALTRQSRDLTLWVECAECAAEIGEHARAASFYERALSLQPGRFDLMKARALELLAAGDPTGIQLLEELLQEHPDDPEILDALGLPAPPSPGDEQEPGE
jgi:tetratricopeptide (TPR) repeat protein